MALQVLHGDEEEAGRQVPTQQHPALLDGYPTAHLSTEAQCILAVLCYAVAFAMYSAA